MTADAPTLRAGGTAELLGELRGECRGGSGIVTTDVDLSINSNYTGRILNVSTNATESFLIIGDPAIPTLGTDTFQAVLTSPQSLRFSAAKFPAPGSAKLTFRIVNLRAAVPATGQTQIIAFLSSTSIPFNNPQQISGFPAAGHSFQLTDASGSPTPALSFNAIGTTTYRLRFDESTQNAFRRRNTATTAANPTALSPQSTYGQDYQTESGFYLPAFNASAGLADHGTRIMATFSNLPPGVSLAIRAVPNAASSATAQARLTTTADDGSGAYTPIAPAGDGTVQLPITGGAARAVWEILGSDAATLENLQFDLLVTTTATSTTIAGITSQLAPVNPKDTADATSSIPRFGTQAVPTSTCGVNCLVLPSSLNVTYVIGGAGPPPIAIPIRSTGAPISFSAVAVSGNIIQDVAPPDAQWLSLSPSNGTTPATLTATINPAALMPGLYTARITVGSGRFSESFNVVLQVKSGPNSPSIPACFSSGIFPSTVRSTGLTERVADIVLSCDPILSGPPVISDFRVTLDTTVTSRPNEILLLVNEPSGGQQSLGTNVFRAERVSNNQFAFRNVTLPADGNHNILRVVNVNADASRTLRPSLSSPGRINAIVRASAMPISSPFITSAFVQSSHTFSLLDSNNSIVSDLSASTTGKLRFVESTRTAFQRRNFGTALSTPNGVLSQNVPGAIYSTETGFYNPALPNDGGIDMGLATQGTRLIARFTNIPPGVGITVSVNESGATTPKAQLIQTDANGAGPYLPITGPTAPVTITNGTGIAVWEYVSHDPLSFETLDFTYQLTGTVPSSATAEGLIGPLSAVNTADANAPLPRFATASIPNPLCNGFPCISSPATITLTSDGTTTPSANVPVTSDSDPITFVVGQPTVPWLTVPVPAGVTPGQFTITANPAGLAPGTYVTQLVIAGTATNISFTVQAAGPAALLLPTERTNRAITAGATTTPLPVTISGTPGLTWQATANVPWLALTRTTGTVPATFDVNINSSLLPAGQYGGHITFTAPGVTPVTYAIGAYVTSNTSGYALSGTITGPGATPRPGVTVTLSGFNLRTATTDANGTFQFTGLSSSQPYTVTPSAQGYTFAPDSYIFNSISPNQIANFTATGPPSFINVLPDTAAGSQATFTVRATDPDGAANIGRVYFLINTSTTITVNSCHGFFDRATRTFFLYNDALTAVTTAQPAGASGIIENSQCRILGPGSSPGADTGTESNFQIQFALKGAFANQSQNVYFWAQDNDGNGTGWLKFATWTPIGTNRPTLLSAGSLNDLEAFSFLATDPDNNLSRAYFLIAPSPNITTNSCHGYYDFLTNQFALYDDLLTTLGTENSTCAIDLANSTGTPTGNVTLTIRRKGIMPATKAFLWLVDSTNLGTGWVDTGLSFPSWTNFPPTITNGTPALATGATQTFTAVVTDRNTRFDVTRVYFLINPTPTIPANTCHGFYDRATNQTYLYNDNFSALSNTLLENSQCRLQAFTQTATTRDSFTLSMNVTRKGAYLASDQTVYLWPVDAAGNGAGWVPISVWANPANAAPTVVPPNFPTIDGSPALLSFTARDANGANDIDRLYFLIHPTPNIPLNTCHGFLEVATSRVYLYNDALTALLGPLTPGAAQTIQNSQCAITGTDSSIFKTATDVTLNLKVTSLSMPAVNTYLWPVDKQGAGSGWGKVQSWGPSTNRPPILGVPISPPSIYGPSQTTAVNPLDPDGAADISRIYFLMNPDTTIPQNTCHGYYDAASNAVFLYNDALTGLLGPLTPGSSAVIQNSRCSINGSATSVATSGNTLQFHLNWTMKTDAPANVYMWAADRQNAGTGWVLEAHWSAASHAPAIVNRDDAYTAPTQTVTFVARDIDGATDIKTLYFLIHTSPTLPANICYGYYDAAVRRMWLLDDRMDPNSHVTQNTQCAINQDSLRISTSPDGKDLILTIDFTLKTPYGNTAKNVYLWALDNLNGSTGWVQTATWFPPVNTIPSVYKATPSAITGTNSAIVNVPIADADGLANLTRVYFLVATSPTVSAGSCHGFYDRATNGVFLYNDALTALSGPASSQNSQCAVSTTGLALPPTSATAANLTLPLTLQGTYAGTAKKIYILAADQQNHDSGWVQVATWN